ATDAEGPGQVTAAEGELVAQVDDDVLARFGELAEALSRQRREPRQGTEQRRPGGVELLHAAVVGRKWRRVAEDARHERLLAEPRIEVRVGDALEAESGEGARAHAGAAHRAGAVARVHLEPVG